MEIYLMQHGPNLPPEQDPAEGLSPQGEEIVKAAAQALKQKGVFLDLILASPKKRAQQTAALVAKALGYPLKRILLTDKLKALTPAEETLALLDRHKDKERILAAGHLPNLGLLASHLLSGGPGQEPGFVRGAIFCVQAPKPQPGAGRLSWHYLPKPPG